MIEEYMRMQFSYARSTLNFDVWLFKIWDRQQTLYIPKGMCKQISFEGIISSPSVNEDENRYRLQKEIAQLRAQIKVMEDILQGE